MTAATLVDRAAVLLCLGPGGVGKTTTSAALGVAAAQRGRRVVVLTIDPARRLADAMGLHGELDNEPRRIDLEGPGELWAAMLDARATFDELIRHHSPTPEAAERVMANRIYQNLATNVSGTNEYMAAERLRALANDDRFDLVIVDTPPSRQAVDFFDAPDRLVRFFDHRLYRSILAPRSGVLKAVGDLNRLMLRALNRVVGVDLVDDVIDFFEDMRDIDQGFARRAAETSELLVAEGTHTMVVTAPRHDPAVEARWIADQLRRRDRSIDLLVTNRLMPVFRVPARPGRGPGDRNLVELAALSEAERSIVDQLVSDIGPEAAAEVPEAAAPIADLAGLRIVAEHLVDSSS